MSLIKSDYFFYMLYTLFIVNQVLSESQFVNMSVFSNILFVSRYAVLGLLVLFIIINKEKYSLNTKMFLLGVMFVFMIINLLIADGGLSCIPIVLFIIASREMSVEKLLKISIWTLLLSHLFCVFCVTLGWIEDVVSFRYLGDYTGDFFGGAYYRHNMGFLVHNQIALVFFIIYLLYIVIKKGNIKWFENIIILALNYWIFKLFGSRVVFLLVIAVCIGYYTLKLFDRLQLNINFKFGFLIYPLCAIISFLVSIFYSANNPFLATIDLFLNNRLRLAHEALSFYGIGLIGSGKFAGTYNSLSLANNTVDNGYIALFLQNGIIVSIILIVIWMYITYISTKNKNKYLTLVLMILAIENFVNFHLTSFKLLPLFCIFLNQNDQFLLNRTALDSMNVALKSRILYVARKIQSFFIVLK